MSAIASPSAASEPASATTPGTRAPPAIAPISAAAAGSQMRIESISASALEEEVEADGGDAHEHQPGVDAEDAALGGAHERRARAHQPGGPADQRPVDQEPLEGVRGEAAEPGSGADDEDVDRLVEVPLVLEQGGEGAQPPAGGRRERGLGNPHHVGDGDAPEAERRAEGQA